MRDISGLLEQLATLGAEAVVAGAAAAASDMAATRAKQSALIEEAALVALLGPATHAVAGGLVGEVVRLATPRYAQILAHPRLGREQLIDELDAAEKTFNSAVLKAQGDSTVPRIIAVLLAGARVEAITVALGGECIAGSKPARQGGALPRRRAPGAADLPPRVGDLIVAIARGDDDALARLAELRGGDDDRNALVTKLVALHATSEAEAIFDRLAREIIIATKATGTLGPAHAPAPPALPRPADRRGSEPAEVVPDQSAGGGEDRAYRDRPDFASQSTSPIKTRARQESSHVSGGFAARLAARQKAYNPKRPA